MNDKQIRLLATGGVLAAAIFLLTAFARIGMSWIGFGYLNLGDMGVFFVAMLLPAEWAALSAGVGSMLADLIGYPLYAPVTLVVKGMTALVFALLWRRLPGKLRYLAFLAVLIVPFGYFLYEQFVYGVAAAWAEVPLNLLQAVVGAGLAFAVDRATKSRFRI